MSSAIVVDRHQECGRSGSFGTGLLLLIVLVGWALVHRHATRPRVTAEPHRSQNFCAAIGSAPESDFSMASRRAVSVPPRGRKMFNGLHTCRDGQAIEFRTKLRHLFRTKAPSKLFTMPARLPSRCST